MGLPRDLTNIVPVIPSVLALFKHYKGNDRIGPEPVLPVEFGPNPYTETAL